MADAGTLTHGWALPCSFRASGALGTALSPPLGGQRLAGVAAAVPGLLGPVLHVHGALWLGSSSAALWANAWLTLWWAGWDSCSGVAAGVLGFPWFACDLRSGLVAFA